MFDMIFMILLSLLNMLSIILYLVILLFSMDVIFCRENYKFKRILSRKVCVEIARFRKRFNIDHKYGASTLVFFVCIGAILMKLYELNDVKDYLNWLVTLKVILSIGIPSVIIKLYLYMGYRFLLFK